MTIHNLPAEVAFRKTWRPYQKRILDELSSHLNDEHLHVIAAPGSGKTVLGLEVVCRLNRPALILAPTLTIRDQWVQRFCEFFLPDGEGCPEWITTHIHEPRLITVSTYQALHCACSGEQDGDDEPDPEETEAEENGGSDYIDTELPCEIVDLPAMLNAAGVRTLVVDEAHHLRTNWWKSLIKVKQDMDNPAVVVLTATPPYDVPVPEWERYRELCGPAAGLPAQHSKTGPHDCIQHPQTGQHCRNHQARTRIAG